MVLSFENAFQILDFLFWDIFRFYTIFRKLLIYLGSIQAAQNLAPQHKFLKIVLRPIFVPNLNLVIFTVIFQTGLIAFCRCDFYIFRNKHILGQNFRFIVGQNYQGEAQGMLVRFREQVVVETIAVQ